MESCRYWLILNPRQRVRRVSACLAGVGLVAVIAIGCQSETTSLQPLPPAEPTVEVITPIPANPPGIGQPIQTATEIAEGVNEFPLTGLRVNAPEIDEEAQTATITGRLNVQRHSDNPATFDPLTLFFELVGADSGATLPATTVLPRIHPSVSHAEVEFEMTVPLDAISALLSAYPDETGLQLIVHLGSESASAKIAWHW